MAIKTDFNGMSEHIEQNVAVYNQRLYVSCQLKSQNLPVEYLDSFLMQLLSLNY